MPTVAEVQPLVREYREEDLAQLREIQQRLTPELDLPDLNDPLFFEKVVIEEAGRVEMAAAARLTCELVLILGDYDTPRGRLVKLTEMHRALEARIRARELVDDGHCWVPPKPEFDGHCRRLNRMGWRRDDLWRVFRFDL